MKKATCSVVIFTSIAAASIAGVWLTQRTTANAESLSGRAVLHYVDPMHPAYTSSKPGTAPDCGMALEPVYADDGASARSADGTTARDGMVNVSPRQRRLIGVKVAPVERSTGTRSLRVFGRVAVPETRLYKINVGVGGYISELSTVTTGSHVDKGQWLATFTSPDTRQPIVAYLTSLDVLDRAEKNNEPAHQVAIIQQGLQQNIDRLFTMGMSAGQVEDVGRKRVVPSRIVVAAPASGVVLARTVTVGQKVEMDSELFQIADLQKVWIFADASGLDAQALRDVAEAAIALPGHLGTLQTRITERLPVFDPATQSLKLRLEADNPDYLLRPDMLVDVELRVPTPPAITVPREAVVQTGLEAIVFVERGDGQFEPRRVQTGWRAGDRVEVTRGLEPGERVAASGTFLLDSDRRMRLTSAESGVDR